MTAPGSHAPSIQAFLAAQGGASNAPHTTWVDLHGVATGSDCTGSDCITPQQILNVGDLQTIKTGFIGKTYIDTPGQVDPGDCP